jgi:MFS family permease
MNMMVVHQAACMVDAGHSPLLAASLVGAVGLLGSLGGILGGLVSDRIGREMSYALCCLGAATGVVLLLLAGRGGPGWPLWAFVLLYGLGHGALSPITAAKSGDLFSGSSIGRIMGLLAVGFGLGGALGAYGGGLLFDLSGSYTSPFLMLILFHGIGALGMWLAGRKAR